MKDKPASHTWKNHYFFQLADERVISVFLDETVSEEKTSIFIVIFKIHSYFYRCDPAFSIMNYKKIL